MSFRVHLAVLLSFTAVAVAWSAKGPLDEDVGERSRWFLERRRTPDGSDPWRWRLRSLEQLRRNIAQGLLGGTDASGDRWLSIGPSPLFNGTAPYTGRVSALEPHPTDADTLYVGTANGGVWRTTDRGTSWSPLTDLEDSLAVGAIAIDPSDSQTVYVGTGEANGPCPIYGGAGLLKSTDAGASWTKLGETEFGGSGISGVIVHPSTPQTLWVSNRQGTLGLGSCQVSTGPYGVWKSLDGGLSWTQTLGPSRTLTDGSVSDLAISSSNPDLLLAGAPQSGVYRSVDGGTTWQRVTNGLPTFIDVGRVEIAFDPVVTSVVYVSIEDPSTGGHRGVWKSTNNGLSFATLPKPGPGSCMGFAIDDLCSYTNYNVAQCFFYHDIAVAGDRDVWLAGLGIYRSGDGGSTWTSLCSADVHVDQHAIAIGADGTVWYGNDGGVFSTTDDGQLWQPHNTGLDVAQFYPGGAAHPTDPDFALGGTQDNGALEFTGGPGWSVIDQGDRWRTWIAVDEPNNTWYVSGAGLSIYKTIDAGTHFDPAQNGIPPDEPTDLYAPWLGCPDDSAVFVGGSDNVWRSDDAMGSWVVDSPDPLAGTFVLATAAAFLPAGNGCSTYFVAFQDGSVWRTVDSGANWTEITGGALPGPIAQLAFDPRSSATLWASVQGFGHPHLWRTTNALDAGPAWVQRDIGIPDTPANGLALDPRRAGVVWLATDIGVFRSADDGASWAPSNDGHPRAVTVGFAAGAASRELFSYTHGRGAFRLDPDCGGLCDPVGPTLAAAKSPGTVDYQWDPVNCTTLDVYVVYGADDFAAPFPTAWTEVGRGPAPNYSEPLGSPYRAFRVVTENVCAQQSL